MSDRTDALLKVRRLRALAASTTEAEARTALALAGELIQKHALTDEELAEPPAMTEIELEETQRRVLWKTHLASYVAEHAGCRAYNRWGKVPTGESFFQVMAAGSPEALSHAKALYALYRLEIQALGDRFDAKDIYARRSYLLGAAIGLGEALQELRERTKKARGTETAMVLVSSEEEAKRAKEELLARFRQALSVSAPAEPAPGPAEPPPPEDLPEAPDLDERAIDGPSYWQGHTRGKTIRLAESKPKEA